MFGLIFLERGITLVWVFLWLILGAEEGFVPAEHHWQIGTCNHLMTFCFPFGVCTLAENSVWNKMHLTVKHLSYLVNIFPHVPKGKPEQYSAKQGLLCLLKHIKLSSILGFTTFPFYLIKKSLEGIMPHSALFWFSLWGGCTVFLFWRDQDF